MESCGDEISQETTEPKERAVETVLGVEPRGVSHDASRASSKASTKTREESLSGEGISDRESFAVFTEGRAETILATFAVTIEKRKA